MTDGPRFLEGQTKLGRVGSWAELQRWRLRYLHFPAPPVDLAMGPVWFWPYVETHKATKSKGGRPKRSS